MSWASIASNQCVSFNNLQDAVNNGVFLLKNAIPASQEQITKSDANYYVYIDTSYGPYASKASNQLIVKSNLQAEQLVTIYWDVREQGSGHVLLVIKDSSNTTILSQVSSNTGPINGVLTITQSQTPYSVTVSVDAGTEVAQYRICDLSNDTQITLNTYVPTTDTYTVSPTPLITSVYATYGDSNTPIACPVA